jgi:uncharacterized protein (DUF2126 family)
MRIIAAKAMKCTCTTRKVLFVLIIHGSNIETCYFLFHFIIHDRRRDILSDLEPKEGLVLGGGC